MKSVRLGWISTISIAAGLLIGGSFWLRAQASDARPIAALMPPGALLYLEAKDFRALLDSWNSSTEKRRWARSSNFQVISMSRLVQRLSQAQEEFAAAGGVPVGMDLAHQVAGARSGFAFYNLSALSFVYLTQMPTDRIEATSLWRSRIHYQSREVAGIPFYLKVDAQTKRSVAFTSYKGWFLVATDEERMAQTLILLSGAKAASLANAEWFSRAVLQSQNQGELRLVYDLNALLATPQFRTYWIHRNASELRPFREGISDLFITKEGFEERRTLLRRIEMSPRTPQTPLADVLAYAKVSDSLYRAWSDPDSSQISDVLEQTISGVRPPRDVYNSPAPEIAPEAGAVGSEADLEIRIDEPPFQRSNDSSVKLVDTIAAMQPMALLQVQTTSVIRDQVFVLPGSSAVILCKQPDQNALTQAVARLPQLQTGALDPLMATVDGNAVIISRTNLTRSGTSTLPPLVADASYTAGYNHRVEWPRYRKLFAIVDTRASNPEMPTFNSTPSFFSNDIQSLGDSLARLQSASIVRADAGAVVHETVRYQLAQP